MVKIATDSYQSLNPASLHVDMVCLEWSTGSSTLWALMRVKHLISIEHHARWSEMVATQLSQIFSAEVSWVQDMVKAVPPRCWHAPQHTVGGILLLHSRLSTAGWLCFRRT